MKTNLRINRKTIALLGLFTIGLLVVSAPSARAVGPPSGTIDSNGNQIVFSTGSLTAVFEGMGPRVTFYDHSGMTRVHEQVNFRALIEFTNTDNDGIFQHNESVAGVVLDEARWVHTGFYNLPDGSGVGINFTQADPITLSDMHGTLAAGSVTLIVKAYNTTRTMTVDGKSVTIGTAELKFDVMIKNWPFHNTTNMLALQVNMHSSTERYDLDQNTGTQTVDGSHDESTTTPEHSYSQTSDIDQETRFSTGSITTSTSTGFFRFVNKATVTSPTGQVTTVPVTASYKAESENDAGDRNTFMKLYLTYPNYQGTLVHDPSIGLSGTMPTLYFIAGGAAVAGLATVLVVRHRHVRIQKDTVKN